ncbi:MAG TPA: cytochrome c-type biogenesis protein CcmH [Candidatus Binataceae bacterium]|nr:cytochrome c-type biogenesis protein CcmH [Candidatus Binataceae bacterium]
MKLALVIAMLALLIAAPPAAPAVTPKTSRQAVAEGLTCQCGCGLTVANCNHPNCEFSVPAREKIDHLIAQGLTRVQIIAIFRAKYGEKVLSSPTTQGFNLLAWVTPPLVMVMGAMLVMFTISRWRTARPGPAPPGAPHITPPDADNPDLRRELERRLRERI